MTRGEGSLAEYMGRGGVMLLNTGLGDIGGNLALIRGETDLILDELAFAGSGDGD